MKIRKLNYRIILTAIFSTAFGFVLAITTAENAVAQRKFDPKAVGSETEARAISQFAQDLLNFIKQAQYVEQENVATEADFKKLQDAGKRVKDGTSNFRSNLQGLVSKLKNNNRWNEDFDTEFLNSITSPRVRSFIQRIGGARKALSEAEAALGTLAQDVDATVNEAKKSRAMNVDDENLFVLASAASPRGASKVRVKCVLLGVGVAVAEAARLKLTAENLDNLFDSNKCGSAGGSTATE